MTLRRFTKAFVFVLGLMLGWSLGGCSGPIKAEHLSNVRLVDGVLDGRYKIAGEVNYDRPWYGSLRFRVTLPNGETATQSAFVDTRYSKSVTFETRGPGHQMISVDDKGRVLMGSFEFVRSEPPAIRKPHAQTFYVERIYHNRSTGSSVWTVKR